MIDPKKLVDAVAASIEDIDKEIAGLRARTQELNTLRVHLDTLQRRAETPVVMVAPK
jgi:prefoldin subunit 5